MEVKAKLNYLHMAPRKVRLVTNLLKNMSVARARLELEHTPKRTSAPLLKLLQSAVANAKHNFQIDGHGLHIKEIMVNPGPVLKRFEPRAFGRAAPVRKRSSHILLILETGKVKAGGRRKIKKEGPVEREISREDIREEFVEDQSKRGREIPKGKPKIRTPDFVRRVFKRKVI